MIGRTTSYWERNLPPAPPLDAIPDRTDVLIVGAGFMGRWLAHWLTQRKPARRVVVVEADRFGYGASTRNAGFLTCGHITESLEDVRTVGFDRVAENFLARRAGVALIREAFPDLVVDSCGSADFDQISDEKRELAVRLNAAVGESVFEEREVCFAGRVQTVHFSTSDGGLDPVALLTRLARGSGAMFRFGRRVTAIGGGVAEVDGQSLSYDRAFICTNAFASQLDPQTKVEPGRGQVIVTTPVDTQTDRVLGYLDRGYDYFRFVDGRLLLGGGRQLDRAAETTSEIATTLAVGAHLRKVARRILGHDDWHVEHHWAGIMGFVAGEHVGGSPRRHLDSQTEVIAGFGGMGVALTPATARAVAAEL